MPNSTVVRGFSPAAQLIAATQRGAANHLRESATFSKQTAYEQAWDSWQESKQPNWDGDNADAIDQQTYYYAYVLIESLPPGTCLPNTTPEPDGHLCLEWYINTRRVLSVSVSPEGVLYWAALIGAENSRGSCQFFGDVPETILGLIRRVCCG